MCLTEPQADSDLGLERTRDDLVGGATAGAAAVNGAPVRISGGKILISGRLHDLTDNIVHRVLRRLAYAPAGTKGLSLASVPKLLLDGRRNTGFCGGIEKKTGIKCSGTYQRRFEQAEGWWIGEPSRGLVAMLLAVNAARLHVGLQGAGHRQAATQNAWRHVHGQRQMRAAIRPTIHPAGSIAANSANPATARPDPIAWRPAVRRILWTLQARTDACGLVAHQTALLPGEHEHHPDAVRRAATADHVALLPPVAKALFTNPGHPGAQTQLAPIADALAAPLQACPALQKAVLAGREADAAWPLRAAGDVLHGIGQVLLCWAWARTAGCALTQAQAPLPGGRNASQWLQSARFGLDWLPPQAQVHCLRAGRAGAALPWLAA